MASVVLLLVVRIGVFVVFFFFVVVVIVVVVINPARRKRYLTMSTDWGVVSQSLPNALFSCRNGFRVSTESTNELWM